MDILKVENCPIGAFIHGLFHAEMERYVFLDFDGVINTRRHKLALFNKGMPLRDDYGPFFDPKAVENLRDIVTTCNAGIIITSTWKYKGIEAMHELWAVRKMPGIMVDVTPKVPAAFMYTRGREINKWLAANAPDNPMEYCYVIIDDGFDYMPEQEPYLVTTDPVVGLTPEDAEKAKDLLL